MTSADYAALARAKKVSRLADRVPRGASFEEADQIAIFFANLSPADRHAFAADAGVKPPSDVTWEILVQVLRDRAVPPRRPMTLAQATRLGVEAALGGSNLLNGRDPREDGIDIEEPLEDETTEVEPETMDELVNGREDAAESETV